MFTGIVEETGLIEKIRPTAKSIGINRAGAGVRARLEKGREPGCERLLPDGGATDTSRQG